MVVFSIAAGQERISYADEEKEEQAQDDVKSRPDDDKKSADPDKSAEGTQDNSKKELWIMEGYLRIGYRGRFTREYVSTNESDQDIKGILDLEVRDREKKEKVKFSFLGNFNLDIDGSPSGGPYSDAYDTYHGNFQGQIYSAYLELKSDHKFIFGRQSIYKGESLDFDGVRTELRCSRNFNLSLYGGSPVNHWESSRRDDYLAGGGFELGVPKKVSLRCDYLHIRDKKTYEPGEPVADDDVVVFTGEYTALKPFSLYRLCSFLEGEERRALLRAKWADKKRTLWVSASAVRQNVALTDYSTELSPYYIVLAEYAPYYQYKANIVKGIFEHIEGEIGVDIRRLRDKADEGTLNHSYERFYGTLHLVKLLDKKVDASATFEKWNASGRNDKQAIEGEVNVKATPKIKLRLGTDYSLYKYDYNLQAERENVISYVAGADYNLSKTAQLRFKYSYEQDDREDYNTVELFLILQW